MRPNYLVKETLKLQYIFSGERFFVQQLKLEVEVLLDLDTHIILIQDKMKVVVHTSNTYLKVTEFHTHHSTYVVVQIIEYISDIVQTKNLKHINNSRYKMELPIVVKLVIVLEI